MYQKINVPAKAGVVFGLAALPAFGIEFVISQEHHGLAVFHELEPQAAVGMLNPNAFHRGFADHYKVVLHLFSELNVRSQFGEADRKKTVPQSGFKDGFQTHLRARRAVDYYPG